MRQGGVKPRRNLTSRGLSSDDSVVRLTGCSSERENLPVPEASIKLPARRSSAGHPSRGGCLGQGFAVLVKARVKLSPLTGGTTDMSKRNRNIAREGRGPPSRPPESASFLSPRV